MEGQKNFLLQISQELRKIGFSEKASLIYGALLEMGSAYPSRLAEYTRLNRTTVYKVLNDLTMKGLVTEIDKNSKLCYQLEKPARLLNFVKRQIGLAEERYDTVQKLFPQLKDWFARIPDKPSVRFFEGLEGIFDMADLAPPMPKWWRRRERQTPWSSSRDFPRKCKRAWEKKDFSSQEDKSSGWRLRAPF
jgi:DNA-binding MarR family transcriptional regulator